MPSNACLFIQLDNVLWVIGELCADNYHHAKMVNRINFLYECRHSWTQFLHALLLHERSLKCNIFIVAIINQNRFLLQIVFVSDMWETANLTPAKLETTGSSRNNNFQNSIGKVTTKTQQVKAVSVVPKWLTRKRRIWLSNFIRLCQTGRLPSTPVFGHSGITSFM